MKLDIISPRKYGDVREMIKRSDEAMKSSHRKSYVWISRAGGRGVIGFKLEELNRLIDEWNNHPCPLLDFGNGCHWKTMIACAVLMFYGTRGTR